VNADRITYAQLSRLTRTRDKRTARAVENAVRGVSAAQHAIRRAAAMIRPKLAETVQRLDLGLSLNDLGEFHRMPADLDRAVTLRQHHWQVLGALLTEAELACLQLAAQPAPDRRNSIHPAQAAPCPPTRDRRDLVDQAKIVIRDIHRYGDDLTVAEAIARLRGGGPGHRHRDRPGTARRRPAR